MKVDVQTLRNGHVDRGERRMSDRRVFRMGKMFPTQSGFWWIRELSVSYAEIEIDETVCSVARWGEWEMFYVIVDERDRVYTRSTLVRTTSKDVESHGERITLMSETIVPLDCVGPIKKPEALV